MKPLLILLGALLHDQFPLSNHFVYFFELSLPGLQGLVADYFLFVLIGLVVDLMLDFPLASPELFINNFPYDFSYSSTVLWDIHF